MTDATPWSGRRLHLVGIGGVGMSGLALVGTALGARVSGSDRVASPTLERLRAAGIEVMVGHDAANVPQDAELVYSTAIPPENPERAAAAELGQPELHRAQLLAEITRLRRCIAVTGTHGKTTTAAMVVDVLRGAEMDPGYLVGGQLRSTGSNAGWGAGDWVVVEADESDRSLVELAPEIAVLTNAELDHHATYGSRLELEDTLREFLARAALAVIWDRPELLALREGERVAYEPGGVVLEPGGSRFRWRDHDVRVPAPGLHNARNAVAALEVAALAGADPTAAVAALASFGGTGRRFERVGATATGAEVHDDYAHHPTEIAATIAGARTLEHERLLAVFQPHLFSRTAALARELGTALAAADITLVLDVYPARERAEDFPGVTGRLVAAAAADAAGGRPVYWLPALDDAQSVLSALLRPGDLCLTLGAGDIDLLAGRLVE